MSVGTAIVRVLAFVGAAWIVWTAYGVLTPESADVLPDRLSTPVGPADGDAFAAALAANLTAPVLAGNRVVPLHDGEEIFPAMLDAIRGARRSIDFLAYVYWQGDVSREFAAELSAACRRGVETRVLLDAYGARKMDPELVERMRASGCRVARFHPLHWYTLRRLNNRTHRRALVVDGTVGFTGGVGIAAEWTGAGESPGHWRDDQFRVEGPVVRSIQAAFAENWREATGEALAGEGLFPDLPPAGEARVVPVLERPAGSVSRTGLLYWMMLAGARERVRIWTPYFVPDPDLEEAIEGAARRGVRVQLLVPGEHNDVPLVRWASRTFYGGLLDAGVEIYEYRPTMMHVKAVTVDGAWSVVGTANFDNRSFELNYEIALAVEDADLTAALDRSFEGDLGHAREVTREDVARWSVGRRVLDHLALVLREQI